MKLQALVPLETSLHVWVGGAGQWMARLGKRRGIPLLCKLSSCPSAHVPVCVPHCPDPGLNVNEGSLGHVETLGKKNLTPLLIPIQDKWRPPPRARFTAGMTRTLISVSSLFLWYGDLDPGQMLCH